MKLSPMMEQYMSIKNRYKDCILSFFAVDAYDSACHRRENLVFHLHGRLMLIAVIASRQSEPVGDL